MDLRQLRQKSSLTIAEVAKALDCSESSIRNWEHSRTEPTIAISKITKLLSLYNCTVEQLHQAVEITKQMELLDRQRRLAQIQKSTEEQLFQKSIRERKKRKLSNNN